MTATVSGPTLRNVILADLAQGPRPQQIGAAVANIEDDASIAPDRDTDKRGTHCRPTDACTHCPEDGSVRFVKHLNGSTEPYFTEEQLLAAHKIAGEAVRRAEENKSKSPGKESSLSQQLRRAAMPLEFAGANLACIRQMRDGPACDRKPSVVQKPNHRGRDEQRHEELHKEQAPTRRARKRRHAPRRQRLPRSER